MNHSNDTNTSSVIYHHDVMEFVQVAVQFCGQLEQASSAGRKEFVDVMLKLMPLLYMKAQLLPQIESDASFLPDDQVTEADYEFVRNSVVAVLGNADEYLDVVYDEMLQTDETRWKSIAENLADIYQPVRNFLATYQGGIETCMFDALWQINDQFELFWGEAVVDALRRLHRIKYAIKDTDNEDNQE